LQRSPDGSGNIAGKVAFRPRPARSLLIGVGWALLTVLVWGAWPAFTRLAVSKALAPEDLVLLRYGLGGLILCPVLMHQTASMPSSAWREGIWLALFQGAPLALVATTGVRFAPASHLAALSPGLIPLFTALLGRVIFGERISVPRGCGLFLIIVGAFTLAGLSFSTLSSGVWRGDAMFICAGLMGSIYAIRMRRSGLPAMTGAALIGVYSMIFYVPLYCALWLSKTGLMKVPVQEVFFQAFYQGVLMGAVTLFSLSRAIVVLGAARAAAFLSLIPVLGTILGLVILDEIPSHTEVLAVMAITLGALLATGVSDRSTNSE
jgi:drug/metabolite transporter (DMT)-like permease